MTAHPPAHHAGADPADPGRSGGSRALSQWLPPFPELSIADPSDTDPMRQRGNRLPSLTHRVGILVVPANANRFGFTGMQGDKHRSGQHNARRSQRGGSVMAFPGDLLYED
jgi:hypothetical protein